jgi:hypothetical protein
MLAEVEGNRNIWIILYTTEIGHVFELFLLFAWLTSLLAYKLEERVIEKV